VLLNNSGNIFWDFKHKTQRVLEEGRWRH